MIEQSKTLNQNSLNMVFYFFFAYPLLLIRLKTRSSLHIYIQSEIVHDYKIILHKCFFHVLVSILTGHM